MKSVLDIPVPIISKQQLDLATGEQLVFSTLPVPRKLIRTLLQTPSISQSNEGVRKNGNQIDDTSMTESSGIGLNQRNDGKDNFVYGKHRLHKELCVEILTRQRRCQQIFECQTSEANDSGNAPRQTAIPSFRGHDPKRYIQDGNILSRRSYLLRPSYP